MPYLYSAKWWKMQDQPLVDRAYLLERYPGKGGWTYAAIPEILQDKSNPFGWVQVRGSIDGYMLSQYKLMPMGEGRLFLPVKADIRKIIGKQAGDWVHVILYEDNSPPVIPPDILDCLSAEPEAQAAFEKRSAGEQKAFIDWINSAKKVETQAERIAQMIDKLLEGRPFR